MITHPCLDWRSSTGIMWKSPYVSVMTTGTPAGLSWSQWPVIVIRLEDVIVQATHKMFIISMMSQDKYGNIIHNVIIQSTY